MSENQQIAYDRWVLKSPETQTPTTNGLHVGDFELKPYNDPSGGTCGPDRMLITGENGISYGRNVCVCPEDRPFDPITGTCNNMTQYAYDVSTNAYKPISMQTYKERFQGYLSTFKNTLLQKSTLDSILFIITFILLTILVVFVYIKLNDAGRLENGWARASIIIVSILYLCLLFANYYMPNIKILLVTFVVTLATGLGVVASM